MSTAAAIDPNARPCLARRFRLQWEEAQQAHVLLYPEGMVKLNRSAAEILTRCDGTRTVEAIVAELEQAFNATNLSGEVAAFLGIAAKQGWIGP